MLPSVDAVDAVQVPDLRRPRGEVGGEVGDLLVVQVRRLVGHQGVLAGAGAVGLERVREVVAVLAADLRIRGIQRLVAVDAVAVDAGLSGGGALHVGAGLAFGDAALRQGVHAGGADHAGFGRCAAAGGEEGHGAERQDKCGRLHGAAHSVRPERKAAISAMSWSEKLCAWTSMVGCLRVPLRYSVRALTRYSVDWPPIFGTW